MPALSPPEGDMPASAASHAGVQSLLTKRHRGIVFAFLSSAMSKGLATAAQFIALPLALHALGTGRYAAFLALQAFMAWAGLFGLGIVPTLPRFLSQAHAFENVEQERDLVGTAIIFMLLAGALLATVLLLLGTAISPIAIAGSQYASYGTEIDVSYRILSVLIAFQVTSNVMFAIRSGYQELYISSSWTSAANVFVILGMFWLARGAPTIWQFALALYGPVILSLFLDAGLLGVQRPYLFAARPKFRRTAKSLLPHATNALATQLSFFLVSYVPLIIVAHMFDARATAAYGTIVQIVVIGNSGMNLIVQSVVPAIANARAHGDFPWIRRAYLGALLAVLGVSVGFAAILTGLGPWLFKVWLRRDLGIDHTLCALFGAYFALSMSSMLHFSVLGALGELRRVGWIYLLEGSLAIGIGTALSFKFGIAGMAAGLALASLMASGWYTPSRVWRALGGIRTRT